MDSIWKGTFLGMMVASCAVLGSSNSPASSMDSRIEDAVDSLVQQLTQDAVPLTDKKLALTDLTDDSGQKTRLTAYVTDKLGDRLAKTGEIHLIGRSREDVIMKGLDLNPTGYIDERSGKRLGERLGADGLITGTVTDLGDTFDVFVRLVHAESGEIRAVAGVELAKDMEVQALNEAVLAPAPPDFKPPLELHMNLIAQRKTESGRYEEVEIRDGAVLRSGDNLKIRFRTNADSHVYILLFDSSGSASRLFPDPEIESPNKVRAHLDYHVPPDDLWYFLDERTGTETIFVAASYDPMSRLDEMLSKMERAAGDEKKNLSDRIRQDIQSLYRGMEPAEKPKPPRPIEIAGTVGHEGMRGGPARGAGGIRAGEPREFRLGDGRAVQKVTEVVRGYATAVRAIHFEHRD